MKVDETIDKFALMMVERMEQMKDAKWEQGWLGNSSFGALPKNISGRDYSGCNLIFLMLHTEKEGFRAPVYTTFNRLKSLDLNIKKGAKSFPIVFWDFIVRDRDGNKVDLTAYNQMSDDQRGECEKHGFLKSYNVFNIDQSDMEEKKPDLYKKLTSIYRKADEIHTTDGMYECHEIDDMIKNNSWVCPIEVKDCPGGAFYSVSKDNITIPEKSSFNKHTGKSDTYVDGQMYYDVILHEMAHSTGAKGRLNRLEKVFNGGDTERAREELIAELSGALVGNILGFNKRVEANNAAYLNSWIKSIQENPRYIISVMADVSKAANMILEYTGIKTSKMD